MDIKVIFVIALFITGNSGDGGYFDHECIHDKIAEQHPWTIPDSDSDEGIRERRQADGYLPYRMAVYFVTENITNSSTIIPFLNDTSGEFRAAINYLQSVLSVKRASRNLVVSPSCATRRPSDNQCTSVRLRMCGRHVIVPDEHLGTITVCDPMCREVGGTNTGVDADFILYVTAVGDDSCGNRTLAYASTCGVSTLNHRSLVGYTNICPMGLQRGLESTGQAFFIVMLHEMLHALGFSRTFFENRFVDSRGNQYSAVATLIVNGTERLVINSPKVLNYGREYYSCPNLQGILLENNGENGSTTSHWGARTLNFEVMNAAASAPAAYYTSISNFTLNLLEDGGWYKVNYVVAESLRYYELLWGKGLGCSFHTPNCDTWPYSCSTGVIGCSYDYQARSFCGSSTLRDGCNYFIPYSNRYCNSPGVPMTNSCFPLIRSNGDLDGRCYARQCYRYPDAQEPFYTVTRFGSTQLCPYDGATLTFSGVTVLTCPPTQLTCSRNTPIIPFDSTSNIPSPWCHDSCGSCSRPVSPAHCLTCNGSLSLHGAPPSVCTDDICSGSTFLDSLGNCTACAAGCRACTGPNNSDCLACEDETLYRVTTNQATSRTCVTAAECASTTVSRFGDRTCSSLVRGGASSIYHQFWLLVLLMICSLVI